MLKVFKKTLLVFLLFLLTSCSRQITSYKKMNEIYYGNIFEQSPLEYYIYIYKPYVNSDNNCYWCDYIKAEIFEYANYARTVKSARPIYLINYNDRVNNKGMYGSSDQDDNISKGASKVSEISIVTTPYLMLIKRGRVTDDWDEATPIANELKAQMD